MRPEPAQAQAPSAPAPLAPEPSAPEQSAPQASAPQASEPVLFLVVLGGRAEGCHIELHDVRFVVGRGIDDTLPALRRQWFGRRKGLHLDAFMAVRAVDGWSVSVQRQPPPPRPERLWFVNLGAYDPRSLAELHHFGLVVARSAQGAKAAARRQWLQGGLQRHKDDLWELDDCLSLDQLELLEGARWHIALTPHPEGWQPAQVPDWFGYRPI